MSGLTNLHLQTITMRHCQVKGCARVATCHTVHHSQRRRLLRSCGVSNGPTNYPKNYNASLIREGCARAIACCTVCHSQHRQLFRSCGILDGLINFPKNYNVTLIREGCACVVAYGTVCHSWHRRLLCSCGVSDGPTDSVRCLTRHSLCRWKQRSCANFDMSWLNFVRTLIWGTRFSKELVCLRLVDFPYSQEIVQASNNIVCINNCSPNWKLQRWSCPMLAKASNQFFERMW